MMTMLTVLDCHPSNCHDRCLVYTNQGFCKYL